MAKNDRPRGRLTGAAMLAIGGMFGVLLAPTIGLRAADTAAPAAVAALEKRIAALFKRTVA